MWQQRADIRAQQRVYWTKCSSHWSVNCQRTFGICIHKCVPERCKLQTLHTTHFRNQWSVRCYRICCNIVESSFHILSKKREREMKVSFVISASLVMLNDRHAWALFSPLSNEMRHSLFGQLVFNLMHISENIITRRALVNSQIALPCHCNCCCWQQTADSEGEQGGRRAFFYFMQAKHDVDDGQRFIWILWHFHRTLTTSADRNLWNYFWICYWLTKLDET